MRAKYEGTVQQDYRFQRLIHLRGLSTAPPLQWWRTQKPEHLDRVHVKKIREVLLHTDVVCDGRWLLAVGGDAAAAIGIAIEGLNSCGMMNPLTDAVISAALCCALEGDPAARVLILSALRRRARIDPICHGLRLRWLTFDPVRPERFN